MPKKRLLLVFVRKHVAAWSTIATQILLVKTIRYGAITATSFPDKFAASIRHTFQSIYWHGRNYVAPYLQLTRLVLGLCRGLHIELVRYGVAERKKDNERVCKKLPATAKLYKQIFVFVLNLQSTNKQALILSTSRWCLGPDSASAPSRVYKKSAHQGRVEHHNGRPRLLLPLGLFRTPTHSHRRAAVPSQTLQVNLLFLFELPKSTDTTTTKHNPQQLTAMINYWVARLDSSVLSASNWMPSL